MTETLQYWTPGGEERQLRIFISHRYGDDQALYDDVIRALHREGFSIQDISLSASQMLKGPRGGDMPELSVQAEVAARIYMSDILIAPSRPAVSRSGWVTWEVQLAAVGYGIPILFVNQSKDQQRKTRLVSEAEKLGIPHAVCEPTTHSIVSRFATLVQRPNWGVRNGESDVTLQFRGPIAAARTSVLRKFPFRPRLSEPDLPPPPPRPRFWDRFIGRAARH